LRRKYGLIGLLLAACMLFSGCTTFLVMRGNEVTLPAEGAAIDAMDMIDSIQVAAEQFFLEEDDIYTSYFTEEEYSALYEDIKGTYGGIGAYFYYDDDTKRGCISDVMKDSPALKAGVKAGDELLKVDGEDVTGQDLDMVVAKVKGEVGTKVTLVFLREGEGEVSFTITRDTIEVSTVERYDLAGYPDIAYVVINSFNSYTAQEFKTLWQDMKENDPPKGLLIDLRFNPGGEVNAALDLADLFIPKGEPILWLSSKTGDQEIVSRYAPLEIPLVLLQNEYSASAAEIVLGALQDNGIGVSVGTKSFGKGIIQTISPLQGGTGIRSTTTRYFTPSKRSIHGVGITPDVVCPLPEGTELSVTLSGDPGKDLQLAKGIEILKGIMK